MLRAQSFAGDVIYQEMDGDRPHGHIRQVAKDGTVIHEGMWLHGLKHGEFISRDRATGAITSQEIYARDQLTQKIK